MRTLRNLIVGTLLAAAAVATVAAEEARIETFIVTAKPAGSSLPAVEKVSPPTAVDFASPMPTDMPEAEVDYHMQRLSAGGSIAR